MSLLRILQSNNLCNVVIDYLGFSDAYRLIYYVSLGLHFDIKAALCPVSIKKFLNRSLTNALYLFISKYDLDINNILEHISNLNGIIAGEFALSVFIGEFHDHHCLPSMNIFLNQFPTTNCFRKSNLELNLVSELKKYNYKTIENFNTNHQFSNIIGMYNENSKKLIEIEEHYDWFETQLRDPIMETMHFRCLKCTIEINKFGNIVFYCENLTDVFRKIVRMNDDINYRFNSFIHNPEFDSKIVPILYRSIQMGQRISSSYFKLAPRCKKKLVRYKKKYDKFDFWSYLSSFHTTY
jgi:hypothetical protein